ncbi:hypothetical protein PRZ48_013602 [Zasmidium cellare]|uniref:Uncharacterized protein n=1 Tax=Zasmidium cellare TaxID=395010 RepID=A0ABR0E1I0_ZASCE|nr:hypothetical protein PRZ48_013602 [Zasmidium cellare]
MGASAGDPTLDEVYEALKKSDPSWLEATLLDRWRQNSNLETSVLGVHDVTGPAFATSHQLSKHLTTFRDYDWSSTELGPLSAWPHTLRQWVNIVMADPRAVALWWGHNRLCLYNDAYRDILGGRHSWALSRPITSVWPDEDPNTARLRAAFDHADATGQPTLGGDTCFFVDRSGFKEEVWAQWTLIPIMGPSGNIAYFNPCSETTKQVFYDRRMATLLSVERASNEASNLKDWYRSALQGLESNPADIPFAALYSMSNNGLGKTVREHSTLESLSGTPTSASVALAMSQWELEGVLEPDSNKLDLPATMDWDLAAETFGPLLGEAFDTNEAQLLDIRNKSFPQTLRSKCYSRAWGDLCTSALIIPLAERGRGPHRCFLLLGLNPCSRYDKDYQKFTTLVTSQLRRTLDSVCLEEAQHVVMEAELTTHERAFLAEQLTTSQLDVKDREMRFRKMADMSMVGMFEVSAVGKLNYANPYWYNLTGYPRGDQPALDWIRMIHEDDRDKFAGKWSLMQEGEALQFEIRLSKPFISDDFVDGQRLQGDTWVAAAAHAEYKDGKVLNVVGTVADISRFKWMASFEQRRTAEAYELKRQQEAFMDMTSHEARNPLAAISLSVESILDTYESMLQKPDDRFLVSRDTIETSLDSANTIMACVAHQKTIIDDVLTLSKLNSGLLQTSPVEVNPVVEVDGALKIFEPELQQADIELEFNVKDSYHQQEMSRVLLDPVRLRQILINLFTNAIKFTKGEPRRQIAVSLAASKERPSRSAEGVPYLSSSSKRTVSPSRDHDNVYVMLAVEDTGCGIGKSELDRLFQRFQQASPKTHIKYGGSGLGLFICKELARLQGGQIGVMSERSKGSTFAFYVQATKCAPSQSGASNQETYSIPWTSAGIRTNRRESEDISKVESRSPNGRSVKDCHILLVEDNLVNQRVMMKQLQKAGYTVNICNHGQEALDYINTTHFAKEDGAKLDIVLCDVEMPVMDGLEFSQKTRTMERQGQLNGEVPMIAVTANARVEQQELALQAGFDAVITKPFRMNALLPELERFCLGI